MKSRKVKEVTTKEEAVDYVANEVVAVLKTLTAEHLLGETAEALTRVDLPRMKGCIYVREPTAEDGIAFMAAGGIDVKSGLEPEVLALLGKMVVDENGQRIFNDEQLGKLNRLPAHAFMAIVRAVTTAMGLGDGEGELEETTATNDDDSDKGSGAPDPN